MGKIPHRNSYSFAEHRRRLTGGTDKKANGTNQNIIYVIAEKPTAQGSMSSVMSQQIEEVPSPPSHSQAINEKKIDEIIDSAIQNLQEAGKALVSLQQNHTNEIKKMVMDVLNKFQKWIDMVQKKMDAAKNDMSNIRKLYAEQALQLADKDRELMNLRKKPSLQKVVKPTAKKKNSKNQSSTAERYLSNPTAVSDDALSIDVPVRVDIHDKTHGLSPAIILHRPPRTSQPPLPKGKNLQSRGKVPLSQTSITSRALQNNPNIVADNVISENNSVEIIHSNINHRATDDLEGAGGNPITSEPSTSKVRKSPPPNLQSNPQTYKSPEMHSIHVQKDDIASRPYSSPLSSSPTLFNSQDSIHEETPLKSTNPELNDAILPESQSSQNNNYNKNKDKRVSKLEAELKQLRNENLSMRMEYIDYGKQIHKVLLGITSLNNEALKVMDSVPYIRPLTNQEMLYLTYVKSCKKKITNKSLTFMLTFEFKRNTHDPTAQHNQYRTPLDEINTSKGGESYKSQENEALSTSRRQATGHKDRAYKSSTPDNYVAANQNRAGTTNRERLTNTSRISGGHDGFRGGLIYTYSRGFERYEPRSNRNRRFIIN
ncbi:hypothetical protein PV327_002201 [Microctonus hyperodae]|uniref:Uncharacterized protein n=1 Tax=Microctonus hyperodae TaxID=165561 RepID=A0AA39FFA2_MICHY|nr:hypothetical protein PV327_002201 [Microctonus hyperodae]